MFKKFKIDITIDHYESMIYRIFVLYYYELFGPITRKKMEDYILEQFKNKMRVSITPEDGGWQKEKVVNNEFIFKSIHINLENLDATIEELIGSENIGVEFFEDKE